MSFTQVAEISLVRGGFSLFRSVSWQNSLKIGAALGDTARRLGVRRSVAAANLAAAFPEWGDQERCRILEASYRELGRVIAEYARLPELARSREGEVVAEASGLDHLLSIRGRGALLLTGHFGNFELFGAYLARYAAISFVARTLRNPRVEAFIRGRRVAAGVEVIQAETGARQILERLRAGRWVAMLGDQDGGRNGAFVQFLGRPASTMVGPAKLALASGVPLLFGYMARREDGRHAIEIEPPPEVPERRSPDAAERLTATHVAALERWVRRRPESWFWLHRRWKTVPPVGVPVFGNANPAQAGSRP